MSTDFEFWTEETTDSFTEEFDLKLFEDDIQTLDQNNSIMYLMPITLVEDTAMAVFIFSLGILLNTIILRSCWKEKSATSTYFRAFALIDIASVAFMLMRRIILFVWPANTSLIFSTSLQIWLRACTTLDQCFLRWIDAWLWRSLTTSGRRRESCEWRKEAWFL